MDGGQSSRDKPAQYENLFLESQTELKKKSFLLFQLSCDSF